MKIISKVDAQNYIFDSGLADTILACYDVYRYYQLLCVYHGEYHTYQVNKKTGDIFYVN